MTLFGPSRALAPGASILFLAVAAVALRGATVQPEVPTVAALADTALSCRAAALTVVGPPTLPAMDHEHAAHPTPGQDADLEPPTVRWRGPTAPEDRHELDRWCRGVGPPVIHRPSPGSPSAPGRAEGLVVAAWNAHVGNGDLERFIRDLRQGHLTGRPANDFVLLLQEVFRAGEEVPDASGNGDVTELRSAEWIGAAHPDRPGEGIDALARRQGLHLFYAPSMRNGHLGSLEEGAPDRGQARGPAEDRGNAILSTLPLTDLEVLELPVQRQRRAAAAATVEWTDARGTPQSLRVVSVHLDPFSGWRRIHRSLGADRAQHVRLLVDLLGEESHVVVGGDFNTWFGGRREEGIRLMERHFPHPGPVPEEPTLAYRIPFVNSLLDHLFFRLPDGWEAHYRVAPEQYGSDHRPLVGWVGPTSGSERP